MNSIKIIAGFGIAVFLFITLSSLANLAIPSKWTAYPSAPYDTCQNLIPAGDLSSDSAEYKVANDAYMQCQNDSSRKVNDDTAKNSEWVWLSVIGAFIAIIAISVTFFKKAPFLAAGLIAGASYFAFANLSGTYAFTLLSSGDLSHNIWLQVTIIKLVASVVGLATIILADILLFEKE